MGNGHARSRSFSWRLGSRKISGRLLLSAVACTLAASSAPADVVRCDAGCSDGSHESPHSCIEHIQRQRNQCHDERRFEHWHGKESGRHHGFDCHRTSKSDGCEGLIHRCHSHHTCTPICHHHGTTCGHTTGGSTTGGTTTGGTTTSGTTTCRTTTGGNTTGGNTTGSTTDGGTTGSETTGGGETTGGTTGGTLNPEPSSFALMAIGVFGLAGVYWRQLRRAARLAS